MSNMGSKSFEDRVSDSIWRNTEPFINYTTPIGFQCKKCGTKRKTKPLNVVYASSQKCNNCTKLKRRQEAIKKCRSYILEKGWRWLNDPQVYNSEILCHCGHTFSVARFSRDLYRGVFCQKCIGRYIDPSEIKLPAGYEFLGKQNYKNQHSTLTVRCNNGHKYKTTQNKLVAGYKCPKCAGNEKFSKKDIIGKLLNIGYIDVNLINNGENNLRQWLVRLECKQGHFKKIKVNHALYSPYSCSSCNSAIQTSEMERELVQELEQLGFRCSANNRSIISPFEIDVALPDYKLGVELCGVYYHQEKIVGRHRHRHKYQKAIEAGWGLLTFFEDEWAQKKDKILGIIKARTMSPSIKLMARKCKLVRLDKGVKGFLEDNHFQGSSNWKHAVGLLYNDELISVMTLGYHPRNSSVILDRYAVKSGIMVQGGARRLFNEIVKIAREESIQQIVSFSDLRYSSGGVYERLGFRLDKKLPPDYYWVGGRTRWNKSKFRVPAGISEREKWESEGYYRVFDCGKDRWVYPI